MKDTLSWICTNMHLEILKQYTCATLTKWFNSKILILDATRVSFLKKWILKKFLIASAYMIADLCGVFK